MASIQNNNMNDNMSYIVATDNNMNNAMLVKWNVGNQYTIEMSRHSKMGGNDNTLVLNIKEYDITYAYDKGPLLMRTYDEIKEASDEYAQRAWYLYCLAILDRNKKGTLKVVNRKSAKLSIRDDEILKSDFDEIIKEVEELQNKNENVNFETVSSFDWGVITAKCETLRWGLGCGLELSFDEIEYIGIVRSFEEITALAKEYYDRNWYHRQFLLFNVLKKNEKNLITSSDKDIDCVNNFLLESGPATAEILIKYGSESFRILNEYDMGKLIGRLSASRWLLGSSWDDIDT